MWSCVKIYVDPYKGDMLEEITDRYHSAGARTTNELHIDNPTGFTFDSDDLILLATRFKNLKKLHFADIRWLIIQGWNFQENAKSLILYTRIASWPDLLPEPWTSLQELHLDMSSDNYEMFKDVDLHISFPNLTLLSIDLWTINDEEPFLLPDLSGCEHLQELSLIMSFNYQLLSFQSRLEEQVTLMTPITCFIKSTRNWNCSIRFHYLVASRNFNW